MNPVFPLSDVLLRRVTETRRIVEPLYADSFWQINQQEFAMQIQDVGNFYSCQGREIEYAPAEGATLASVELYLNGSVYGAILHQRNILPFHGSSFVWNGEGILLCGESGAGKSSLTAAFCLAGAEFLTDDVTPVIFKDDKPHIVPLSDRIKLWNDSLQQLNQENNNLNAIYPGKDKYYFPMQNGFHQSYPLNRLFILEIADSDVIEMRLITGVELFTALRNEIYRWEYLSAMPGNEVQYLKKLVNITQTTRTVKILRPQNISIACMAEFIKDQIGESIKVI
jgi:hypothetical protein